MDPSSIDDPNFDLSTLTDEQIQELLGNQPVQTAAAPFSGLRDPNINPNWAASSTQFQANQKRGSGPNQIINKMYRLILGQDLPLFQNQDNQ